MKERSQVTRDLDDFQARLKELEIRYEQYFAGVEKREPYRERKDLSRQIRQYNSRLITQTDLKFRYHSISSRLASYNQYWDRILRLIDEGKYHRHQKKGHHPSPVSEQSTQPSPFNEAESLRRELLQARKQCGMAEDAPSSEKIAIFLAEQRKKISARYGDKPVEFQVDLSTGKPRIKVRLKK